jgi:hypothetical protein
VNGEWTPDLKKAAAKGSYDFWVDGVVWHYIAGELGGSDGS